MKNVFQKVMDTVQLALIYCALSFPVLSLAQGNTNEYVNSVFNNLGVEQSNAENAKTNILEKIGEWIPFAMGIAASILVIIAIFRGVMIATSGDSPQKRSEALKGVLFLGIGAAVVGGAALLVSLAFGLFQ